MGGNVNINGFKAEPLNCNELHRASLTQVIRFFITDIAELFESKYRYKLPPTSFGGSSRILMDSTIPTVDFSNVKSSIGDIDILVDEAVMTDFINLLQPGLRVGIFILIGSKRHGGEISTLFRHNFHGHISQWDFAFVDRPLQKVSQFLHWSDWEDLKLEIKGVHHKLLINACGLDKLKFSITHGLRSREIETDGITNPVVIHYKLFGTKCPSSNIWSFKGICNSIEQTKDRDTQVKILDKFKESCSTIKHINHQPAIEYLERILDV